MKFLPQKLHQAYQQHFKNHSQPGFHELQDIFLNTIQEFHCVFFVVDALDECTHRAEICQFLARMIDLCPDKGRGFIKVFVASRKELDIERSFQQNSFPEIEVETAKVNHDIRLYVTAEIDERLHNGSLILNDVKLKNKILAALTTNAGGMYVLPSYLQLLFNSQIYEIF